MADHASETRTAPVRPPALIRVASDRWNFESAATGAPFVPVGVNYFGPRADRLLEDVWHDEWPAIETDFARLAALGFNLLRVHLQFHQFQSAFGVADERNLLKLDQLVHLAGRAGLRLDLTGLAHYRKSDIPAWFLTLDDDEMLEAEVAFWDAIARRYVGEPTIFCYDLQNEPVVAYEDTDDIVGLPSPGGLTFVNFHFRRVRRHWTRWVHERYATAEALRRAWNDFPMNAESWTSIAPPPRGWASAPRRADFLEFSHGLAREWTRRMVGAVRRHDPDHLITIGFLPWALPFDDEVYSTFAPWPLRDLIDFVAVHVYPVDAPPNTAYMQMIVRAAHVGLPVVLEELDPILPADEESAFYRWTLSSASGWLGFYYGSLPEELERTGDFRDAMRAHAIRRLVRFARDEVPRTGVVRRATRAIPISIEALRVSASGRQTRRTLLRKFAAAQARGHSVDLTYR